MFRLIPGIDYQHTASNNDHWHQFYVFITIWDTHIWSLLSKTGIKDPVNSLISKRVYPHELTCATTTTTQQTCNERRFKGTQNEPWSGVALRADSRRKWGSLSPFSFFLFFLFFFHVQQSLVLFVMRVAEHLLSWPPFKCPSRRVCVCVCVTVRHRFVYVSARLHVHVCVCVGMWVFAAVGALLLMAAHCSLSLSLSQPVYGPFPFSQRTPQLNLCPWTQAFLRA